MRGFLDAIVRIHDERPYAHPDLRLPLGAGTAGELEIRRLEATRVDGDEATVAVEGTGRWTLDHPVHGRLEGAQDLSGPVELRRVSGSWRVLDFCIDGRRQSRAVLPVAGGVERDGLRLEALQLELGSRHTALSFTVENRGPRPALRARPAAAPACPARRLRRAAAAPPPPACRDRPRAGRIGLGRGRRLPLARAAARLSRQPPRARRGGDDRVGVWLAWTNGSFG